MPIAEVFLSAFLQVLFDRLASRELLHFARRKGIETLLKKWEVNLISINRALDDAEDRQLNGDRRVESWLEHLRNLAYDIEDLLDEFTTESKEKKSKAEPSTSKVRFPLPSCCFNLSPRAFMFDCTMGSKMKELDDKLQNIITLKQSLSLSENNGQPLAYRPQNQSFSTHFPEEFFIGREDKKMEILELLTGEKDDRTCMDIKVMSIVGMAGLGKTALTQQVYNDDKVTDYFDMKAWVCVSTNFDKPSITRSILETTNPKLPSKHKTLPWLQEELKKDLSGKKFLVVLDDLWERNYEEWTDLLKPFIMAENKKGSKIIVTTRDFEVAKMVDAQLITLELLLPNDCMTLLEHHLLKVENFDHRHNLEVFGWKMVEKCNGLPLAMKALAGVLRSKYDPHEWEEILNSKFWDILEGRTNIPPALRLSYLYLPCHLKRCFAYCAIFPKDYEIRQDELIHWWIAEGLVQGKEANNQWDVGLKYFKELVNRSLFLKSSSNESLFLMHDLVNDLAKLVAGVTCFDSTELKCGHEKASSARHASFTPNECILPEKFQIYQGMKGLRSFISTRSYNWVYVSQKVLCDLLSTLRYLRVLSLNNYDIPEVPECIGKLRLLRHLNLSYTCIKTLPKSIVALYNLEALMLRGCENLLELPDGIEKLINLRFLDIIDTPSLKAMPPCIGNLVGLEMSKFIVGTGNGSRLKELKNLENLSGKLCISDLHKVQEVEDANDANLCAKKGICRLTMQWSIDFEISRNIDLEGQVLNSLRPHQNLEDLTISYYGGLEFPSWLASPSYINIVCLHLHGCRGVKALPLLGHLPSLKELYIEGLNSICTVGSEFHGSNNPFPSLLTLEFKGMLIWEDWSHCIDIEEVGVVLPCLDHLVIQDCPKLKALPSFISLPSLNKLKFKGCNERVLRSLVSLASLTALTINDVVELTCLNRGYTSSLIKLEKLKIVGCTKLRYLWQDRDAIRNLNCLKSLVVRSCPEFIYFVAEEGDIDLPGSLETIKLKGCVELEKLPSKMHTLSSLRDLTVYNCPKLVSFLETGIPTSMISLNIEDCKMLRYLPRGLGITPDEPSNSVGSTSQSDMTSCLQDLKISGCDSLTSSPFNKDGFLPTTLKRLDIYDCSGVESLAEINLDPLQSLQEIFILNCENLRSLPQGLHTLSQLTILVVSLCPALEVECFPSLPPGISIFSLRKWPKIKSLPNQLNGLTCLRKLAIEECERFTRFPDRGLPPQLRELEVATCEVMKQSMREWLTSLTSLEVLRINSSVGGAGEEEDLVLPLPSSLLDLRISGMLKVERLSSSLPPSLQKLWIQNCLKLRKLPLDDLSPSFEELFINNCPILEKRCKKGTGCYWPFIREIPHVFIM